MAPPAEPIDPDRYGRLLDGIVSVSADLSLAAVLRRIVETASEVIDARYAALGVISDSGTLREFVYTGLSLAEAEAIGPLPVGRGLLGTLIDDPRPVRLEHLSADPRSVGFPPNHPKMDSFLGVPVHVGDATYGNLYLTEKRGGAFTAEDEALAKLFASAAGAAVANAVENERRNDAWLAATRGITQGLVRQLGADQMLQIIVDRLCDFLQVDVGYAARRITDQQLLIVAAHGAAAAGLPGTEFPLAGSLAGRALLEGEICTFDGLGDDASFNGPLRSVGAQSALVAPLPAGLRVEGILCAATLEPRAFAPVDVDLVAGIAEQSGVVLEVGETRREIEELRVFQDRERIARELHDTVIQRIFATGMSMQAIAQQISDPALQERQRELIDQLDDTISDIRSTIFTLQAPVAPGNTRSKLQEAVREVAEALQFRPSVRFDGAVDTALPDDLSAHVVAVVREALANVAKHAGATQATVRVGVDREHATVVVVDDGVGFDTRLVSHGHGLHNMAERARSLEGVFSVHPAPDGGTELLWRVPLSGPEG